MNRKYIAVYTLDKNTTKCTLSPISAKDYTEAYVEASLKLPAEAEITGLFEIIESNRAERLSSQEEYK